MLDCVNCVSVLIRVRLINKPCGPVTGACILVLRRCDPLVQAPIVVQVKFQSTAEVEILQTDTSFGIFTIPNYLANETKK